jgi:prepilin-type N-terminal cleavage/methylation domain-containing protein/prepilin-type processing-associated H-X9-DG protein
MRTSRAFTLIELLVVIVIIALLAAMVIVVVGPFQRKAQMVQATTNMKQLWSGMLNYTGSHDGELPPLGEPQPAWGPPAEETKDAWYNSVPVLAGGRSLSSFQVHDEFYNKNNLLFIPSAQYPKDKNSRPYFAVSLNEKLYPKKTGSGNDTGTPSTSVRLQSMVMASKTVVFFESGLPGEKPLDGQHAYFGKASGWVPDIAARYNATESDAAKDRGNNLTNIVFGDGHVASMPVKMIIAPGGGAFYPQVDPTATTSGSVSWTLDPETNPNGN